MLHKVRLLTPGPTPIPDSVRQALSQAMLHHRSAAYKDILANVQPRLQALFGTKEVVMPLACTGTGAMTAAIHSLFSSGETILVVEGGVFADRWKQIATVHGLNVISLQVPWNEGVDANKVAEILDNHPEIVGLCMQATETSTGVLHPVKDIAPITKKRNVLCVVDGISSVGIAPCPMDELGVDCLVTGSQKGLMTPPGLALIALSEKGWEKAASVKVSCFYFNLIKEKEKVFQNQSHFTSPVNLILGLHEALNILFDEKNSLESTFTRQWAFTCMVRKGLEALGLELFVKKHYTWGLTSFILPDDRPKEVNSTTIRKSMLDDHGILVTAGAKDYAENVLRFGHMGWLDYGDLLAGLHALAASLKKHKALPQNAQGNALEIAMEAYHKALALPYGTIL